MRVATPLHAPSTLILNPIEDGGLDGRYTLSLEGTMETSMSNATYEDNQTLPVVFIVRVDHDDTSYFFLRVSITHH